jgi:hypothetical protein
MGHELLYLQKSYFIAESAPHAVKTYFSSLTGVGKGETKEIQTTLEIFLKGQYLCKKREQHSEENNTQHLKITKKADYTEKADIKADCTKPNCTKKG